MSKNKGFYIEGKVKEHNGKHFVPVDNFKGDVDKVLPEIVEKYAGSKVKRNLLEKLGYAFSLAGEEMEKLVKEK